MSKCYFVFRCSIFVIRFSTFGLRPTIKFIMSKIKFVIRTGAEYEVLKAEPEYNKFRMWKFYFVFRFSLPVFRFSTFGLRPTIMFSMSKIYFHIRAGAECLVLKAEPEYNKFWISRCYFVFRYSFFVIRFCYSLFVFRPLDFGQLSSS